jgi:LysM repeat protein
MENKKLFLGILILSTLILGACTRSASTAVVDSPTQDPIESIFSTVATQTALAANGAKSGDDDDAGDSGNGDDAPVETSMPTTAPTSTTAATATSTAAPTSAPGSAPITYTLHLGEWPYCLARRFDVDPDALIAANGLANATELSVGVTLTIPTDAGAFGGQRSLRSHPTSYTASGIDTFYSIACEFGDLYPENIAQANGKDVDYTPAAGELLQIP